LTDTDADRRPPGGAGTQESFGSELRGALAQRVTFSLVLGVLLIQLGFILSYVGAFHHPTPHRAPVLVVAPAAVSARLVGELNSLPGDPLQASASTGRAGALVALRHGSTSGALLVDPAGRRDSLLVAGGGGAALASAVQEVIAAAEAARGRAVTVTDVVPAQPGDARGLSGFYLVIGWLVGGYLVSALLSLTAGARPASTRRALIRLIALVPYALLSGLGGTLIVGPLLGALTGHFLAIWALGALLVYCAAAVTIAFQVMLGTLGVGLTLLLFVVLGNPSAGGAYPAPLLPGFWRAISPAIPNGAGVQALRRIVYFGSYHLASNLIVIAAYTLAGIAVAVGGSSLVARRAKAGRPVGSLL